MTNRLSLRAPLFVLLLAACSSAPDLEETPRGAEGAGGDAIRVRVDERSTSSATRRPAAHIEGRYAKALRQGETAFTATTRFVREHAELFPVAASSAPHDVLMLRLVRERTDALGMHHVRAQQTYRGVPVRGAELMAHFDQGGDLRSIDTNIATDVELASVLPSLSIAHAESAARTHYLGELPADALTLGRPSENMQISETELVIDAPVLRGAAARPRLAYHLTVRGADDNHASRVDYTIDAHTGAVLNVFDNLQTVQTTSKGALGDDRTFEVTQSGQGYQMVDLSRTPNGIRTYTAGGSQQRPGTLVSAPQLNSVWDGQAPRAPGAAVDAHFFSALVYDFYKTKLARNGINGADGAITSTAHFGQNYANAFWDGNQMTYGDGDNVNLRSLASGLDVIAHELTHGVTQFESNLTYQGQSGAINEAMSDIISAFVEAGFQADAKKNWQVGEVIGIKGPLRDMAHPGAVSQKQPTHMDEYITTNQDNGGVHINSGIINNAAYLMTAGGTNDRSKVVVERGIGIEKSTKLWYRMNEQYLMASSNFQAAADASTTAATDLGFTADEKSIIDCAWKAVGVRMGACGALAPQSSSSSGGASSSSSGSGAGGGASSGPGTTPGASNGPGSGDPTENGIGLDDVPSSLAEDNIVGCTLHAPQRDPGTLITALGVLVGALLIRRRLPESQRRD